MNNTARETAISLIDVNGRMLAELRTGLDSIAERVRGVVPTDAKSPGGSMPGPVTLFDHARTQQANLRQCIALAEELGVELGCVPRNREASRQL